MNKVLITSIFGIQVIFSFITAKNCPVIPQEEIPLIGWQVWTNESARNLKKIISWNPGEEGISLGIAHFTWYPAVSSRSNAGTFPEVLYFLQKEGQPIPDELGPLTDLKKFYAPWNSRQEFLDQLYSPATQALRQYLITTIALQMRFISERIENALPILLRVAHSPGLQAKIKRQFYRLAATPAGRYALVDYTNFTGEKGLFQVLKELKGAHGDAVQEFITTAKKVLTAQVAQSTRDNSRWLQGWKNRVDTYKKFGQ